MVDVSSTVSGNSINIDIALRLLNEAGVRAKVGETFKSITNSQDKYGTATRKVIDSTQILNSETGKVIGTVKNLNVAQSTGITVLTKNRESVDKLFASMNMLRWTMVNATFVFAALVLPIYAVVKSYSELGMTMNKVAAISGQTTSTVISQVKDLQKNTIFSLTEIADGYTEFVKLGFSAADVSSQLGHIMKLATVSFTDLNTAVTITGQTLYQFGIDAKYAEAVTNILAGTANASATDLEGVGKALSYAGGIAGALGVSLEDTAAAIGLLSNYGIKGSRAGTSLAAALTSMTSPSVKARKVMKDLNIEFLDNNNNLKSLEILIPELSRALEGMGTGERADVLSTIFSQRGERAVYDMLIQYEKYGNVLDDVKKKIKETGNVQLLNNIIMNDGAAQTKTATKQLETIWNSLNLGIGKAFTDFNKFTNEQNLKSMFNSADEYVSTMESAFSKVTAADTDNLEQRKALHDTFIQNVATKWNDLRLKLNEESLKSPDYKFMSIPDRMAIVGKNNQIALNQVLAEYVAELNHVPDAIAGAIAPTDEYNHVLALQAQALEDQTEFEKELAKVRRAATLDLNDATGVLKDYKDKLDDTNSSISELTKLRFSGQTDVDKLIANAEHASKVEELASYGIGDAQAFLTEQVLKAGNGFDTIYTKINKVTEATKTSEDSYDAWRETVQEFITDTIKSGNLLGSNVTGAITKYSTMLLSTSKFKDSTTSTPETITQLDALKSAYDIVYGGMESDVNLAIQTHEDLANGVSDSSDSVIDSLNSLWEDQNYYTRAVEKSQSAVERFTKKLKDVSDVEEDFQTTIDGDILSLNELKNMANDTAAALERVNSAKGKSSSRSSKSSISSAVSSYTSSSLGSAENNAAVAAFNAATSGMTTRQLFDSMGLASGGIVSKPTLAIVGESGPEAVVPLNQYRSNGNGTITIENITINGVSGDAKTFSDVFSKELRRQLRTL